jgi:hypothetical protein
MNDLAKIIITTFIICMIIKTYFENRIIPIKQGFQHRCQPLSSIMNKIDRKSFLQNESKVFKEEEYVVPIIEFMPPFLP